MWGGTIADMEHLLPSCKEILSPQYNMSQFSSSSHASELAVTLARPDINLLQGTPEEQGGEPGSQVAWVPKTILPPGFWDPG